MRAKLTKHELEELYTHNTNRAAAKELDVSIVTLIKMVEDAGIKLKGKGYAQKYLVV